MQERIQWRRVAVAGWSLVSLVAIALGAPILIHRIEGDRAERPDPHLASEAQEREFLRAVMDFRAPRPRPPSPSSVQPRWLLSSIVLLDESVAFGRDVTGSVYADPSCRADSMGDRIIAAVPASQHGSFAASVPRKLRQELVLANQASQQVADPRLPGVIYRPAKAVRDIFDTKQSGWNRFYEAFPEAGSYEQGSRPVLTEDRQHALMYVDENYVPNCGTGKLYYLARVDDKWAVVDSATLRGTDDVIFF